MRRLKERIGIHARAVFGAIDIGNGDAAGPGSAPTDCSSIFALCSPDGRLRPRSNAFESDPKPATRLTIRVQQRETEHTVSVGKLQAWLDGGGKSPNEQVEKARLKEILRNP